MDDERTNSDDPLAQARAQARAARKRVADRGPIDPERIGPYSVVARIGSGGMGVVYLAEHAQTGSPAAVKVLRSGLTSGSAARRFEQEIEILRSLEHDGIAKVLDAGTADVDGQSRLYCAMEYIAGRHLLRHAELGELSVEARLRLFLRICEGLAYAHARGILHRDLKPHNILVEMGGQPKIVDFGVARWAATGRTSMHTEIGQILGTVQYMSPEQIQGKHDELDERTDVYGLGVVLFELLTGALPYEVDPKDPIETMRAIRSGRARSPREINKQLSEPVSALVLGAIAFEPAGRYKTAEDLAVDIRRVLNEEPIVGVVPPARPRGGFATAFSRLFGRTNDATRG